MSQPVFLEYHRRVVTYLVDALGMSLGSLVRAKDVFKRAITLPVEPLRAEAGKAGMQPLLGDITSWLSCRPLQRPICSTSTRCSSG